MKTKEIVRTGILTAIVFVSMALLHINLFGSALHLGSLIIVIISLNFNRKEALIASSVGATLFDLLSGYLLWAPFTFIARLLLSLIVSLSKEKSLASQIIYSIFGGCMVISVYFVSYLILLDGVSESLYASIPDVIQLILTVAGVFISIPVRKVLKKL